MRFPQCPICLASVDLSDVESILYRVTMVVLQETLSMVVTLALNRVFVQNHHGHPVISGYRNLFSKAKLVQILQNHL